MCEDIARHPGGNYGLIVMSKQCDKDLRQNFQMHAAIRQILAIVDQKDTDDHTTAWLCKSNHFKHTPKNSPAPRYVLQIHKTVNENPPPDTRLEPHQTIIDGILHSYKAEIKSYPNTPGSQPIPRGHQTTGDQLPK